MACEVFIPYKPQRKTLVLIEQINTIIDEYLPRDLRLTVRQLFYQLVARALFENTPHHYDQLKEHVTNARNGGLIDWDAIEDRTREVNVMYGWRDPADRIRSAAESYYENLWTTQLYHIEVWIEKEALLGVIEGICQQLRVPYCAHRGNASSSLVHDAGKRFAGILRQGQKPLVLHLADHDPTGVDMTRDLRQRLALYARADIDVRRIALTLDQVRQYNPPPNTAKDKDNRTPEYVREFGFADCWELDALPPDVLIDLIRSEVERLIDADTWQAALRREQKNRRLLDAAAENWTIVAKTLRARRRRNH